MSCVVRDVCVLVCVGWCLVCLGSARVNECGVSRWGLQVGVVVWVWWSGGSNLVLL